MLTLMRNTLFGYQAQCSQIDGTQPFLVIQMKIITLTFSLLFIRMLHEVLIIYSKWLSCHSDSVSMSPYLPYVIIRSLSPRDFETRTANASEQFSLITCLHTTTFTLQSTFSSLAMISMKVWETPLSWHAKCPLPVAVFVSKTRVLKPPNVLIDSPNRIVQMFERFPLFVKMEVDCHAGISIVSRGKVCH